MMCRGSGMSPYALGNPDWHTFLDRMWALDEHLPVSLCLMAVSCLFGGCDGDWIVGNQRWLKAFKEKERVGLINVKILFGDSAKAPNQIHMSEDRELPGKPRDRPWGSAKCNVRALMWAAKPKWWTWGSEIIEFCSLKNLEESKEGTWPQGWDRRRTQNPGLDRARHPLRNPVAFGCTCVPTWIHEVACLYLTVCGFTLSQGCLMFALEVGMLQEGSGGQRKRECSSRRIPNVPKRVSKLHFSQLHSLSTLQSSVWFWAFWREADSSQVLV